MSYFIFLTLLLTGLSGSTPTVSLYNQSLAIYGNNLTLTCQVDQDVGLGYVEFRRDGSNIIRITDTCAISNESPVDKNTYSVICNLTQRIFTMVKRGVNYTDHNTSWNCQMYSANGSNGTCVGTTESCISASVKVIIEGPPFVQLSPSECNVTEWTRNFTFTCDVTQAVPLPASNGFSWLYQGSVIQGQKWSTYTIPLVQRSNDGSYQCIATNPYGNGTSKKLNLDVQYAPIISLPNSKEIKEGETLQVTCDVSANPEPVVVWTKSGVNVSVSANLTITSIKKRQEGNYTCTAKNRLHPTGQSSVFNTTSKILKVNVLYGPVVNISEDVTLNEGESLKVECTVDANPPAFEVYWSKDEDAAFYRNSTKLSFDLVSRHDSGTYRCTARNRIHPSGQKEELMNGTMLFHLDVKFEDASLLGEVVGGTLAVIVVLTSVAITVFIVKLRGRSHRHFSMPVTMSNQMENAGSLSSIGRDPIYANATHDLNERSVEYDDLLVNRPKSNLYLQLTVVPDVTANNIGNTNDSHSTGDAYDDLHLYTNYQVQTDVTQCPEHQTEGDYQMYANLETRTGKKP